LYMPSIKDVAIKAGVSVATVSNVLNNKSNVSPATGLAVRDAIAKLGYSPRPPERRPGPRLGKRKAPTTYRIALLAVGMNRVLLNAPVYVALLHGVETALRTRGLTMVLYHAPDLDSLPSEIRQKKLDGLVLFLSNSGEQMDKAGLLRSIPCVRVMGDTLAQPWHDQVTYRNDLIGVLAAQYLLARGHRHTAVLGHIESSLWQTRAQSFIDTLHAAGGTALSLEDNKLETVEKDTLLIDQQRLIALLDRLLASKPRPTGIFLLADIFVPPIYFQLLHRKIQPGKDIEVISCNNEQRLLNGLIPQPATIDIHAEEIGKKAVEHLLWRIEHPGTDLMTILLSPKIVEGAPKT
jgi:LacI family transcriptional regulator